MPPDITIEGGVVKLAQQRRLPAVPHLGADRADIRGGEHQEKLQALGRLHPLDEVADRLRVGEITLEGDAAHQEVPAHQPGDRLGLLIGEAEARA